MTLLYYLRLFLLVTLSALLLQLLLHSESFLSFLRFLCMGIEVYEIIGFLIFVFPAGKGALELACHTLALRFNTR
jgi:hypothetical protein